jgi:hypothetical protein
MVGDVDILAGSMEFSDPADFRNAFHRVSMRCSGAHTSFLENLAGKEIAEAGGIKWPPEPAYVVGIEVKCSYFDTRPRAIKSSPNKVAGIRKQVEWLLKMGLDRVALLDVIANPPSDGVDFSAWIRAAAQASESASAARDILRERLPPDSPSGQFVWAVGPVVGGNETARGAGAPRLIRQPLLNPTLSQNEVSANRQMMFQSITKLLASQPRPHYFPITYVDCRKCRHLHAVDAGCV